MTTTWTKVAKPTSTWTKVAKARGVSTVGSPIGLLLALTYATALGSIWTNVAKASGTTWTKVAKAT